MVGKFTRAFQWVEYPFDLSNHLLGFEFCWRVKGEVEAAECQTPRPPKWEICERVLDRLEKTWREEIGEYCDVGLPYHPPDFNGHIGKLFEQETKSLLRLRTGLR